MATTISPFCSRQWVGDSSTGDRAGLTRKAQQLVGGYNAYLIVGKTLINSA